jgi:hypothetical protein
MPLDPRKSNPLVIIQFGGQDIGSCDLYFQNDVIKTLNNNPSSSGGTLHKVELDPMILLRSASATIADLIGTEIGWVVVHSNLAGPDIKFSFYLDIRQSGTSIITPVQINDQSGVVVNATLSLIFNGFIKLS